MAKKDSIRIKQADIAREAGVCVATVSNYINGKIVKAENAEKIRAAIEKYDYVADNSARITRKGESRMIGIIAPHPHADIMRRVVLWSRKFLADEGYFSALWYTFCDEDTERANLRRMRGLNVQGVIAVPSFPELPEYKQMQKAGIPVITMSKGIVCPGTNVIYSDYTPAFDEVFKLLKGYGHRRISLIIEEIIDGTLNARIENVRRSAAQYGLTIDDDLIRINRKTDLSMDTGYLSAFDLMAMDDPPTAIICANSDIMNGIQIGLLQQGIHFPEDVSVCGCISDEGRKIKMFGDISIINPPTKNIVVSAVTTLTKIIAAKGDQKIVPGTLVQTFAADFIDRNSIGPAKQR